MGSPGCTANTITLRLSRVHSIFFPERYMYVCAYVLTTYMSKYKALSILLDKFNDILDPSCYRNVSLNTGDTHIHTYRKYLQTLYML